MWFVIMVMKMMMMIRLYNLCYDGRDVDHVFNMPGHFALYCGHLYFCTFAAFLDVIDAVLCTLGNVKVGHQ